VSERPYDKFGNRAPMNLGQVAGVAISGTATALGFIAGTKVTVPYNCRLVAAYKHPVTGATAAVALMSCEVCKSAAGTGTVTSIGTFVMNGTVPTGVPGNAATVAGTMAAGDVVGVSLSIGTVAHIHTCAFSLLLEELYS
jgi:hypothetical protein